MQIVDLILRGADIFRKEDMEVRGKGLGAGYGSETGSGIGYEGAFAEGHHYGSGGLISYSEGGCGEGGGTGSGRGNHVLRHSFGNGGGYSVGGGDLSGNCYGTVVGQGGEDFLWAMRASVPLLLRKRWGIAQESPC